MVKAVIGQTIVYETGYVQFGVLKESDKGALVSDGY